jgi:hypothetical protein
VSNNFTLTKNYLMKLFLPIIVFFIFSFSFSQNKNIEKISFDYGHHSYIFSGFNVLFRINNKRKTVKLIYTKREFSNTIKKKYKIPYDDFLKLKEAIFKIDPDDLFVDVRTCFDSNTFSVTFVTTNKNNKKEEINYFVCCLNSMKDKETVWKDFLDAVNLILEFSELKFEDL